jgi:predicted CopG family antitoxin
MKPLNRVKELRFVKASELTRNEANWRVHSSSQRKTMKAVFHKYGIADAMLAYERDGVLTLIDGHLRQELLDGDAEVPVLVVDVTDDEAQGILATHDSIGMMARIDDDAYNRLINSILGPEELEQFSALIRTVVVGKGKAFSDVPPLSDEDVEKEINKMLDGAQLDAKSFHSELIAFRVPGIIANELILVRQVIARIASEINADRWTKLGLGQDHDLSEAEEWYLIYHLAWFRFITRLAKGRRTYGISGNKPRKYLYQMFALPENEMEYLNKAIRKNIDARDVDAAELTQEESLLSPLVGCAYGNTLMKLLRLDDEEVEEEGGENNGDV